MSPASPPLVPSSDACRRIAFPPERRLVLDTLHLGRDKPMMHGLLELDVTRARQLLGEHRKRTGEQVSFTAFVLGCLGRAVADHPAVHALPDWRGRLVLFDDVDATTIVEVEVDGRRFALAHVVRAVNRRTVRDIHDELRAVQSAGMRSVSTAVRAGTRLFLALPGRLRRLVYRVLFSFPTLAKRHTGTLLVTAVGMFGGGGAGWGLSAPGLHNLSVIIGGITRRLAGAHDGAGEREVVCLTVSANHDLVDGAPLTRFTKELSRLLESAAGLDELAAPATQPARE